MSKPDDLTRLRLSLALERETSLRLKREVRRLESELLFWQARTLELAGRYSFGVARANFLNGK